MATVKKRAKKMQGGGTAKKINIPYPKDKNMSSQDSASFRMGYGQSRMDDGYSGITSNRYYEKGEAALKSANAIKKKVKKAQDGNDVPCPPGGGGNCRPAGSSRPSIGANISGGRGRGYVVTKEDEEAGRKQRIGERIMSAAKKNVPQSTAPGVRGEKKGSQSFFGRDRYESEAKYGKKVVKKSAVKKAKVGSKIVKSKKK